MNQAAIHRLLASKSGTPNEMELFELRLAANLTLIKELFFSLYSEEVYHDVFNQLIQSLPKLFDTRPDELKKRDIKQLNKGNWYQSEHMVGMQLYVDHFNNDLNGLHEKLNYFNDLGINFLHLMPLMTRPQGENDGGYAVNSYTQVDKRYGTNEDLRNLTRAMRKRNMYLMLDFVVNHTSDEYPWAKKALAGDSKYQSYYYTFKDRQIPDAFEESLPEIFPQTAPGNFTYRPEMQQWVMTCFNEYQWDLNYANPKVFLEMLKNLVALVNLGVDIVRFDALAFLWKKMGTNSQNLLEAHNIITLFRMCLQVVAPGVVLLAEAIVAPEEIIKYFGEGIRRDNECEIAYNASLMALLWNSIATKKTALLYKSLTNIPKKPKDSTWINYIRCHDDIGLGLDDRFISELGWNPKGHRKFLLDYYCQHLDWSPAKGLLFMYNPKNGDGRITGSAASLLGLEKAFESNDPELIEIAIRKIILLHGIILSFGGIPLIYSGDELATLNDYSFLHDKTKKDDNRWVNRPRMDWDMFGKKTVRKLPQAKVYTALKKMIALRKKMPVMADNNNTILHHAGNEHILVFERKGPDKGLIVIGNFDAQSHVINTGWIAKLGYIKDSIYKDLLANKKRQLTSGFLELDPYQLLWIQKID